MFERCLYFNANVLTRRINRHWDQAFKSFGLSPAHAYLLRLVLAEPGLSQKAIAEELRLEKSTVTRFVDALEAKGLLLRTVGEGGVGVSVQPTQKARRLQLKLEEQGEALFREMVAELGEDELKQLVRMMRKAAESLK